MLFWKKTDTAQRASELLHDLELLASAEAEISSFYDVCARVDPPDAEFWRQFALSEQSHHDTIMRIVRLVKDAPERFRPTGSIRPGVIRLFRLQVTDLIRNIDADTSHLELLNHAADIEKSAAELGLTSLVATTDEEFQRLARSVADGSQHHQASIQQKLALMNAS